MTIFIIFAKPPRRGRPPKDNRVVLEGILWVLKTGARWRDIQDFIDRVVHESGTNSAFEQLLGGVWRQDIPKGFGSGSKKPVVKLGNITGQGGFWLP